MPFHKGNSKLLMVNRRKTPINYSPFTIHHFGFTLIELLVVVSVIGILVGTISLVFDNARDKGRDSRRKSDLSGIKSALALHFQENGYYPCDTVPPDACTTFSFTSAAGGNWIPNLGPYIQKLPKDPKQAAFTYMYQVSPNRQTYTLWATLENSRDLRFNNCASGPAGYNYCLKPDL